MISENKNDDTIETLEELEELDLESSNEDLSGNSALLEIPAIKYLAESYEHIPYPFALLDSNLYIIYRNSSYEELIKRFHYQETGIFPVIFFKCLEKKDIQDLHEHLVNKKTKYSWRGTFIMKSHDTISVTIKVSIYPFFMFSLSHEKPIAYTVMFDDITLERKKVLRSMFLSLLEASKMKDNDTGNHIERVNKYAQRFSEELFGNNQYPHVDKDFLEDIGFLAAMHDVGKIGTPDDILNKSGKLEPWEWSVMKEHTKNGAYILSTYPNAMAKEIALCHHEQWDGSGYPYGLEKEMIPLSARIVSLADVYDALRMKRSYKEAFSHETAVKQINDWSGSHFDPRIVAIFNTISHEFENIFRSYS